MSRLTESQKKERGWYYIGHDKFYWRNCDNCGNEYQGMGSNFCSRKCSTNLKLIESIDGTVSIELKHRPKGDTHPNKLAVNAKKISDGKRGKPNPKIQGRLHPNWKDGLAKNRRDERKQKMCLAEYKQWRTDVFHSDNFKCAVCGIGGKLEAHHILSWSEFPEIRYDIDNGISVCHEHHPVGRNKEKSMVEFFKRKVIQRNQNVVEF